MLKNRTAPIISVKTQNESHTIWWAHRNKTILNFSESNRGLSPLARETAHTQGVSLPFRGRSTSWVVKVHVGSLNASSNVTVP